MVTRFHVVFDEIETGEATIEQATDGALVMYSDYLSIEQEYNKLLNAIALALVSNGWLNLTGENMNNELEQVKKERDALRCLVESLMSEVSAIRGALHSGAAVLNFLSIALRHTEYDEIAPDDVRLAFQQILPATPTADRLLAERDRKMMARGVDKAAEYLVNIGHCGEHWCNGLCTVSVRCPTP